MSNQQQYEQQVKILTKQYLQDTLQECKKCWDTAMKDQCSYNCDQDYILYLSGKRVLKQKLQNCLSQPDKNAKSLDKCYETANKDIVSLQKFVQRMRNNQLAISPKSS
ncbi:hypothetical protein TTHERM_00823730 (macronuclear) [Tetrahymena thermophila SB210]|uniref:Uncharacterized protein n=1 Tax=Tetrahymena thermophila (strain SB210) TaxID=312017 RepID=I7M5Y5_TETTS|nr:hypothetical protein TTHERM_00823730 [Tetrahymena thermophila SB210]EAR83812.3 hypothetical protein TTHERM_00823730 [Tetrahymena thermophila SB210]|eukprot:XP_001031475.3 hypothetical protein TTHERM_00823730 [Tetrahymena thermophila SB210]